MTGYAYDASGTEYGNLTLHSPTGQSAWVTGSLYQRDPAGNIVGITDFQRAGTKNYELAWDTQPAVPQILGIDTPDGSTANFRYVTDRLTVYGSGGDGVFGTDLQGNAIAGDAATSAWTLAGAYSPHGVATADR